MTVRRWGGGAASAVMVLVLICAEATPPPDPKHWSRPEATVVIHGRDRSFGALGDVLASGQELATAPVNGWAFPPESRPGRTVVAADGTVLMAASALTIGAYDPRSNVFTSIRLPGPADPDRAVTDLLVLSEQAVAFSVDPGGQGPVFGVLTRVDGEWKAKPANVFTGGQLGLEGLRGLIRLPATGHLLAVNESISVVKLSGPDGSGHYLPEITAQYRYPLPRMAISAKTVRADPTAVAGDERFVAGLTDTADPVAPKVLQEFSFDHRAGSIRAVSAPLLPGTFQRDTDRAYGFDHAIYDGQGNLWATSSVGQESGKLAVYARTSAGRRPGSPVCRFDPAKPLESYVTRDPDGRQVWGQTCPPDYQLLQAKDLAPSLGLVADPATGTVADLITGGHVLAFRAQGSGAAMTFTAGNPLDIGRKVLPIAFGDFLGHETGAVDARQRLWFPVTHSRPKPVARPLDQWLVSVELADLFDPKPVRLPVTPGQSVIIQAERSSTVATHARKPSGQVTDIDSVAYALPCNDEPRLVGCGYDQASGDGFVIADDNAYGHLGEPLTYRVQVDVPGTYHLSYQAGTWEVVKTAEIELAVLGQVLATPVSSDGGWRVFRSEKDIELPAGTHLITVSSTLKKGGWFLNSFSLQRL